MNQTNAFQLQEKAHLPLGCCTIRLLPFSDKLERLTILGAINLTQSSRLSFSLRPSSTFCVRKSEHQPPASLVVLLGARGSQQALHSPLRQEEGRAIFSAVGVFFLFFFILFCGKGMG